MPTMIYLDQFEEWVGANRDVPEQYGQVTFRWGVPAQPTRARIS